MSQTAFEITKTDIENVLQANWEVVQSHFNQSHGEIADVVLMEFTGDDYGRIEKAALDSGCDINEQTNGAYAEIRTLLIDRGWINKIV